MLCKLIVLLFVVNICFGKTLTQYVNQLNRLTPEQKRILDYTYNKGQEYKLGHLLSAIAWQESNFGMWRINLADGKYGSYSIYHIMLEYYIKYYNINNTEWNRSRNAELLFLDNDKATEYVVELLTSYSKHHKTNKTHDKVIKSYNAGYNINSDKAKQYYSNINLRLQALEIYYKNKSKNLIVQK